MGQTIISNPDTDNIEHTRHRNTTQHLRLKKCSTTDTTKNRKNISDLKTKYLKTTLILTYT